MQDQQLFRLDNRIYDKDSAYFKLKDCDKYAHDDIFYITPAKITEEENGRFMIFDVYRLVDEKHYEKVDAYKHYMKRLSALI